MRTKKSQHIQNNIQSIHNIIFSPWLRTPAPPKKNKIVPRYNTQNPRENFKLQNQQARVHCSYFYRLTKISTHSIHVHSSSSSVFHTRTNTTAVSVLQWMSVHNACKSTLLLGGRHVHIRLLQVLLAQLKRETFRTKCMSRYYLIRMTVFLP